MIRFLQFLSDRYWLNVILVTFYFLMVTLPHEWVGIQTAKVFGEMTRDNYNLIILVIGLVLLAIYLIPLFLNLMKRQKKFIPLFYLAATIALTVLTFNTLVIVNIEIIHFIQYAVLAVLVFPLFNRFLPSLFKVMGMGFADEAYQYYVLAPERTNYFDFNDVILNAIGAAFGLVFLRTYPEIKQFIKLQARYKERHVYVFWAASILLFYTLVYFGFIQMWPAEDGQNHWTLLVKKVPESFWSVVHPNVTCLLYTSPSPRDATLSRMPSSA